RKRTKVGVVNPLLRVSLSPTASLLTWRGGILVDETVHQDQGTFLCVDCQTERIVILHTHFAECVLVCGVKVLSFPQMILSIPKHLAQILPVLSVRLAEILLAVVQQTRHRLVLPLDHRLIDGGLSSSLSAGVVQDRIMLSQQRFVGLGGCNLTPEYFEVIRRQRLCQYDRAGECLLTKIQFSLNGILGAVLGIDLE